MCVGDRRSEFRGGLNFEFGVRAAPEDNTENKVLSVSYLGATSTLFNLC